MSRAPKQDIAYQEKLTIPKEFLRFATPRDVSLYRAERLKCNVLVEIGAGIGGQTIPFSKQCKKVIAIELDKTRAKILLDNLKKLRINNVEVINGDALNKSVIQKIAKENIDIVFVDTERPEQSERTLKEIKPSVEKIIESYSPLTKKIAIEIPPFTQDLDSLKNKVDFEQEFISLNNQLNRLTLYFNELKKYDKCVISLPSKELLTKSEKKIEVKKVDSTRGYKFLYWIDPTVIVADLIDEVGNKLDCAILELNKPVLLSNERIHSNLLTAYFIKKVCEFSQNKILTLMDGMGIGKVILRYNLEPTEYWKVRKFYESKLTGKREINLFVNEDKKEAILCEKL